MTEAITADASGAKPAKLRRLHPVLAFLGGLIGIGLGYLYVGRIAYAIATFVALYLCVFAAGWTGLTTFPVGFYALAAILALWWLVQLVHPVVLAWSKPATPPKRYNRWWWYIAWIVGPNVASLPIAAYRGLVFGFDHYYIPSGAMTPTLQPGDRVVVDSRRYRGSPPAFGDIVVCDFGDGPLLVKRVVGVPGDTIEFRGPQLVRNGSAVDEPYLGSQQGFIRDVPQLTLGADDFFVVGDNRANSSDSRDRGPIARDRIFARVEHIYFSSGGGGVNWERFPVVLTLD